MKKLYFFISFVGLLQSISGSGSPINIERVFDRSSSGFRKIENEIFQFLKDYGYDQNGIDNYVKYNIRIPFEILGVENIRRKDSHRSQKEYLRSHTGSAINNGNIPQKLTIAEFSESFQIWNGITTAWQTHSSNAVGIGAKEEAGVNIEFFSAKVELSGSYTYTWGGSESTSNEKKTINTTTQTYKSQKVTVSPFSKVDVRVDFYSFTDTTHYLVDLHIGNFIGMTMDFLAAYVWKPNYLNSKPHIYIKSVISRDFPGFNILTSNLRNRLNSINFGQNEVKISCTDRCILKDVPIIIKTMGIDTQGNFGPQVPIRH